MNLDEVIEFGGYVQMMLDQYVKEGARVVGQCFETSIQLAEGTEMLIHRRLPHYKDSRISLVIGNLTTNGVPVFDEAAARREANNLPFLRMGEPSGQYHAWLQFERTIIDLTVLYTAYAAKKITVGAPCALFMADGEIFAPDDYGFRYVAYRDWSFKELRERGY